MELHIALNSFLCLCGDMSHMVIVMYGQVWFCMVKYGYVWSSMIMYGQVWLCMAKYDNAWSCMTHMAGSHQDGNPY